jgi:ATP synthase protein I
MADVERKSDAGKHQPPSLDEFSKRLDAARGDRAPEPAGAGTGVALGRALRVASELLAALLVGTALGWGLDRLLGSEPWFLLAGIGLGFAAGVRNLYRAMRKETAAAAEGKGPGT